MKQFEILDNSQLAPAPLDTSCLMSQSNNLHHLFKLTLLLILPTLSYPFYSNPRRSSFSFRPNKSSVNFNRSHSQTQQPIQTNLGMTVEDDAKAYHAFVSAAVDITSVDVISSHSPKQAVDKNLSPIHVQTISFVTSTRDLDTNSRRSYLHSFSLATISTTDKNEESRVFVLPTHTMPMEIPTKMKVRCVSPSGRKVALLVEENEVTSATNKREVLEIWSYPVQQDTSSSTMALIHRIVLPTKKLHGKVSTESVLNGPMPLSWNSDETCIAYCAERIPTKTCSFFHRGEKETGTAVGGEYTRGLGKNEEWGEALVGINPIIDVFIVHIRAGKVGMVSNSPTQTELNPKSSRQEFTMTQVQFTPDGKHVVYVGLDAGMPRRLGLIHCMNRRSWIFCSKIENLLSTLSDASSTSDSMSQLCDTEFACLTNHCWAALSPRFSAGCSNPKLIYLACPQMDTHSGNMALHIADWNSENIHEISSRVLVDQYTVPASEGPKVLGMGFPGLFCSHLPIRCFTLDGKYVYVNTQWGSASKFIKVSTDKGLISCIRCKSPSPSSDAASEIILYLSEGGDAIVSVSEPSLPAIIGVVSSKSLMDEDTVNPNWISTIQVSPVASTNFSPLNEVGKALGPKLTYQVLSVELPQGSEEASVPLQGILLLPNMDDANATKFPLIVVPHGGPHSCTTTAYMPMYSFLCQQGRYAILHVNYRGSTGFGKVALESITGKIGSQDVEDVKLLTEAALERNQLLLDSDRVGICGGSHGGFLGAHMTGQYPDLFKVACLRNPVTNIATMVTSTDIPDWTYIESLGLGNYDWESFSPPTKEMLVEMYKRSPCQYYDSVKAPTLIALGLADKRVPPSQGLEYYYALRSKGIKTKLLVYDEDNHAISKPISEADHWVNIKLWFDENL